MRSPKVLLVNDDSASLLALNSLLTQAGQESGYDVVVARSGEEALRQVLNHDFAVILLDVNMPGMNGFETAEAIHSHPRTASIPIIFVTAHYADEMHKLKGYQRGAVDYLFTPIIPKILQTKVAVFVELAKKNLQMQHQTDQLAKLNAELQHQRKLDLENINERKQAEAALRQSREELRQLASYQDRIKEEERKRIAREIHDELGQNLLALRLDVQMLHIRTGNTHPHLNKRVGSVLGQIDTTMKSMRAIINNLRPVVLDLGLNAAIEWQVKEFQRRSGIPCKLIMDEEELVLEDSHATALFRIMQESLSNVLRHAQATWAQVELYEQNDKLYMKISDNGIGIPTAGRKKENSFGLVGIKERISNLGGTLRIESAESKGTTLTVCIPLGVNVPACGDSADSRAGNVSTAAQPGNAENLQIVATKPAASTRKKKERAAKVGSAA